MPDVDGMLADLLERLADGHEVKLGEFSGPGEPRASEADMIAERAREVAARLRTGL